MIVYAESSAVLAWLLGEPRGDSIAAALGAAEVVVASELTLLECDRSLIRAVATGRVPEGQMATRRARLARAENHWVVLGSTTQIQERARQPLPNEPLRTLDALHLASALYARSIFEDVTFVSLDNRLRERALEFGFYLLPEVSGGKSSADG